MDKKKAGNSERTAGGRQVDKAYRAGVASKRNDNRATAGNIVVKTWCLHGKTKEIQW